MKRIIIHLKKNQLYLGFAVAILLLLVGITIINLRYRSRVTTTEKIKNDLIALVGAFEQIHAQCTILSFDYEKNPINFLNVKSFTGSEVGPMNLAYPNKWQGPYMQDNPTIQGKEYQVIKTAKGYFITPGDGVVLPNGKQIGKNIIFDQNSNIEQMMKDKQSLNYQGMVFAVPLVLGASVPVFET